MATSRKQRIATKLSKKQQLLKKAQKDAKAQVPGAPERIAIHEGSILGMTARTGPKGSGPGRP